MHNKDLGNWGEQKATEFLIKNGYEIIERNFFSYQGEIDIIAKDETELVFIEVKTRRNFLCGTPAESVGDYKQKHIFQTAKYYLYKNNLNDIEVRFDIIEIILMNHKLEINHIKNIF